MPVDKRMDGTSRVINQWRTIEATHSESQQNLKEMYEDLLKADCPLSVALLPSSTSRVRTPLGLLWSDEAERIRKVVSRPFEGETIVPVPARQSVQQGRSVF